MDLERLRCYLNSVLKPCELADEEITIKYWVFDTDLLPDFTYNLTIAGAVNPSSTEELTGFILDFIDSEDRIIMHAPSPLSI